VNIPNVGAVVRVTTRHRNYYIYTAKEQPFVEYTHEGTVLPFMKGDKPGTFNMTGDERMRSRNIAMSNVVKLEYVKGKGTESKVRAFHVKSTDKKKVYLVTAIGNKVECNCTGFTYRRKCKHADAVRAKLK
jgi:hypothetical protein